MFSSLVVPGLYRVESSCWSHLGWESYSSWLVEAADCPSPQKELHISATLFVPVLIPLMLSPPSPTLVVFCKMIVVLLSRSQCISRTLQAFCFLSHLCGPQNIKIRIFNFVITSVWPWAGTLSHHIQSLMRCIRTVSLWWRKRHTTFCKLTKQQHISSECRLHLIPFCIGHLVRMSDNHLQKKSLVYVPCSSRVAEGQKHRWWDLVGRRTGIIQESLAVHYQGGSTRIE